jgi:hypothetical protein
MALNTFFLSIKKWTKQNYSQIAMLPIIELLTSRDCIKYQILNFFLFLALLFVLRL